MSQICQILYEKTDPFLPPEIWYMISKIYQKEKEIEEKKLHVVFTYYPPLFSTIDEEEANEILGFQVFETKDAAVLSIYHHLEVFVINRHYYYISDKEAYFGDFAIDFIERGEWITSETGGRMYRYVKTGNPIDVIRIPLGLSEGYTPREVIYMWKIYMRSKYTDIEMLQKYGCRFLCEVRSK